MGARFNWRRPNDAIRTCLCDWNDTGRFGYGRSRGSIAQLTASGYKAAIVQPVPQPVTAEELTRCGVTTAWFGPKFQTRCSRCSRFSRRWARTVKRLATWRQAATRSRRQARLAGFMNYGRYFQNFNPGVGVGVGGGWLKFVRHARRVRAETALLSLPRRNRDGNSSDAKTYRASGVDRPKARYVVPARSLPSIEVRAVRRRTSIPVCASLSWTGPAQSPCASFAWLRGSWPSGRLAPGGSIVRSMP